MRRALAFTVAVSILTGLPALLASLPAVAETGPLTGKQIRATISGNRIFLQTPFGGEFPLYYRSNGVVDGSGQALGLGRFMAPKDSGKWWVSGNQLCQKWQEWYDGAEHCFTLRRRGETSLYWKRDDGVEGEARIGR